MNYTIKSYDIKINSEIFTIPMPSGAIILDLECYEHAYHDAYRLWVMEDDGELEPRTFHIVNQGDTVDGNTHNVVTRVPILKGRRSAFLFEVLDVTEAETQPEAAPKKRGRQPKESVDNV